MKIGPGALIRRLRGRAPPAAAATLPCVPWLRYSDPGQFDAIQALLAAKGFAPLTTDAAVAERDVAGAARFVLGCVAADPDLRPAFHREVQDAAEIVAALSARHRLAAGAAANLRSAIEARFETRVWHVYKSRADLRLAFPLAFAPDQRRAFFDWLTSFGVADFAMTPEAALWAFFRGDTDVSFGLAAAYRHHPTWQKAVPHGLTRFGWDALKRWIAESCDVSRPWLHDARLPAGELRPADELLLLQQAGLLPAGNLPRELDGLAALLGRTFPEVLGDQTWLAALGDDLGAGRLADPGVTVLAYFSYASGLQMSARQAVDALRLAGESVALRDIPLQNAREAPNAEALDSLELCDITILVTALDTSVRQAYDRAGLAFRPEVTRIAIWWWELELLPPAWHDRADDVDEIWAPTRFIADAMRRTFAKPVYVMPQPVRLDPFTPRPKAHFGMSDQKFCVGFVFDMKSSFVRKNPLGLVAAFERAFGERDDVELVLKTLPSEGEYEAHWRELRAATAGRANIRLIEALWSRDELLAFLHALDCYASLHRAEGLGLTCAEAMLMGKPVLASAYSGNLDFMTPENSYLVPCGRAVIDESNGIYPAGMGWAEPDLDEAARLLREIASDPVGRAARGARAREGVARSFSPDVTGRRMAGRLDAIAAGRLSAAARTGAAPAPRPR